MMGTLKVTFKANTVELGDAMVPLEVIDTNMNRKTESLALKETKYLEVEPGSYLLRAMLPSGEVVSAQVAVAQGQNKAVDLTPGTRSPRETLAWAYYLRGTGRGKTRPSTGDTRISDLQHMHFGDANVREALSRRFSASNQISKLDTAELPEVRRWGYKDGRWVPALPGERLLEDTDVRQDDPRVLGTVPGPSALEQCWIQTRGPVHPPWIEKRGLQYRPKFTAVPPGPGSRALLIFDDVPGQAPDPLNVVAKLSNPQADTILGFLTDGAFSAARKVAPPLVSDAESLLWNKRQDPASAAVAGYFLLLAGNPESLSPAHWMQNLTDWAPWLPDGPVILACYLLGDVKERDEKTARSLFLEAVARGIPLLTRGLRMLFDGLNALRLRGKDTFDVEVNQALGCIRPYAAAADWRCATTSFYAEQPEQPDPLVGMR
jgi:hypothetical protein